MSGRWKYKTETVTAGDDCVAVRGLTAGERVQMLALRKKAAGGEATVTDIANAVVKFGVTSPGDLTDQDFAAMPADLMDAAFKKILELSGVDMTEDEKKEPEVPSPLNS